MKKLIVILLLLGYGLSSFGMTLHVHYCCGKVDQVKLLPAKEHSCGGDKSEKKKGCCDDRQVELKLKADYKNEPSAWLAFKSFSEAAFVDHLSSVATIAGKHDPGSLQIFSPPPHRAGPLYIKHCIYRI